MRRLLTACCGFAAAVFAAYYLLPVRGSLTAAACFCAAAVLLLAVWQFGVRRQRGAGQTDSGRGGAEGGAKGNALLHRAFLLFLGAAAGFGVYALHWHGTLRYAEVWDGTEQMLQVRVMEAPQTYSYYTRVHVQRTEAPKLDLMLYDYRGLVRKEDSVPSGDAAGDAGGAGILVQPGDLLQVTAKLRRADLRYGERNDSYVSKDIYLTGTLYAAEALPGRPLTLRTLAARCSSRLSSFAEGFFSRDTAVFMRSLMLGDKTDFYRDLPLYASMRGAGLMHIVAVSGMHIAFLVGMVQLLFGAKPASSLAGIALAWFFVFMTGASPSAVRAGIMQTVLLMAPIFRRENDGPTSLGVALGLILLLNPFSCASISLQMSFSAMAGMVLLAEPLTGAMMHALALREQSRLRAPVSVVAASLAVLATSAPVTVLHFGTLAVYAPLTNLLGLWAVSLCFSFGWLGCLAGTLWLPLGKLLALPAELFARYLMALARVISRLPHHLVAMRGTEMLLWLLLCYALALAAWLWKSGGRLRVLLPLGLGILSLAAVLTAEKQWYRSPDAVVTAVDVGQGACVCVLSGDDTLMLDCGGLNNLNNAGETAATWLASAGRTRVDTLVLSHLHADHANGVPMLLELMPVRRIILSPEAAREDELLLEIVLAAEAHGTELVNLEEDLTLQEGNMTLRLFAPQKDCPDLESGENLPEPETASGNTGAGDLNERCIISLVSVGDFDLFFTGDAPKQAELQLVEKLTAARALPDTEVLIVGHHGSDTASAPAFLEAIRAEQAIISVGKNNSYGHPTRQVLARLQNCGMEIYRTDLNGTVEVRFNAA